LTKLEKYRLSKQKNLVPNSLEEEKPVLKKKSANISTHLKLE